jgi:hypothetical protein
MPCINRNRHTCFPMPLNTGKTAGTPGSKSSGSTIPVQKFLDLTQAVGISGLCVRKEW